MSRPRITPLQKRIMQRIADGWILTSDGVGTCWIEESSAMSTSRTEDVSMYTAERLILRNLVHPAGHLLPDGWRAIGQAKP